MRNRRARSQSGTTDSWATRSPVRSMRCHSTNMPSAARSEAMRSAARWGTSQCLHQAVMSSPERLAGVLDPNHFGRVPPRQAAKIAPRETCVRADLPELGAQRF